MRGLRDALADFAKQSRAFLLLCGAALALLLAMIAHGWSEGLTIRLFDPSIDPTTIGASAAAPPALATWTGPIDDPSSLWQNGEMIDAWTRSGRPLDRLPPAHLLERGTIDLPESGDWRFSAPGDPAPSYRWRLAIDGKDLAAGEPTRLTAGVHEILFATSADAPAAIDLRVEPPSAPPPRAVSMGCKSDGECGAWKRCLPQAGQTYCVTTSYRPIPTSWLGAESPWATISALLGALALLLAVGAGALLRAPAERAAAIASARVWAPVACVALALVAGTALRAHGRLAAPRMGDTYDELQEAWQGWSLVHFRAPVAWGYPPWAQAYEQTNRPGDLLTQTTWFGRNLLIVRPYLEHPPLFSILVGIAGTLAGASDPMRVPLSAIRLVPLLLSLLFYPLVYAIGRRVAGRAPAALACAVLAVAPSAVLVMRYAKGDLLAALLVLVSIWCALCWRESDDVRAKKRWLVACAVAAGLAPLAKELGVFALAIPALLLAPRMTGEGTKRLEPAVRATAIAVGVTLLYVFYGAIVDWSRFTTFLHIQGGDRIGRFEVGPLFLQTIFLDWKNQQLVAFAGGWLLFWLTAVWAMRGRLKPIAALCFLYLLVLVAAVDGRYLYGWYELPLHGLLAITAGAFLWRMLATPGLAAPLAVTLLGVAPFGATLFDVAEPDRMRALRIALVLAAGPFLVHRVARTAMTERAARIAAGVLIAAFLAGCALCSWRIVELYPSFDLGG